MVKSPICFRGTPPMLNGWKWVMCHGCWFLLQDPVASATSPRPVTPRTMKREGRRKAGCESSALLEWNRGSCSSPVRHITYILSQHEECVRHFVNQLYYFCDTQHNRESGTFHWFASNFGMLPTQSTRNLLIVSATMYGSSPGLGRDK